MTKLRFAAPRWPARLGYPPAPLPRPGPLWATMPLRPFPPTPHSTELTMPRQSSPSLPVSTLLANLSAPHIDTTSPSGPGHNRPYRLSTTTHHPSAPVPSTPINPTKRPNPRQPESLPQRRPYTHPPPPPLHPSPRPSCPRRPQFEALRRVNPSSSRRGAPRRSCASRAYGTPPLADEPTPTSPPSGQIVAPLPD